MVRTTFLIQINYKCSVTPHPFSFFTGLQQKHNNPNKNAIKFIVCLVSLVSFLASRVVSTEEALALPSGNVGGQLAEPMVDIGWVVDD